MGISKNVKRGSALIGATMMMVAFAAPTFAAPAPAAANGNVTVYLTVETSALKGDYVKAPMAVTVPEGSKVIDVMTQVFGTDQSQMKYSSSIYGSYVTGIKAALPANFTPATDYTWYSQLPANVWTTVPTDGWLESGDINSCSGWMMTLNNKMEEGTYPDTIYYNADTVVKQGDVVRWQYSLSVGCDMGFTGWIPNATGNYVEHDSFFAQTDKGALITKLATIDAEALEPEDLDIYNAALVVANQIDAIQTTIDGALVSISGL